MSDDKTKVLIQMRDLRVGSGITSCIMAYYQHILEDGYDVDFLLNRSIESPYEKIVNERSNIYVLPKDTNKPNLKNYKFIRRVLKNNYSILHINISGLNSLISARVANSVGIPARIYHAHSVLNRFTIKDRLRNALYVIPAINKCNYYAACSSLAGVSHFKGKKYYLIKNLFNIEDFDYSEEGRRKIRSDFNIDNKLVIGAVGRLARTKNPFFTIDIFKEIKKNTESVLIWAGDGELRQAVQEYVISNDLRDCVYLLGNRSDMKNIYSAMDMFLLPTKTEGLGLVFVEAQVSGLKCFGSDVVPDDVKVTSNMFTIPLQKSAAEWARILLQEKDYHRASMLSAVSDGGFDIKRGHKAISNMYERVLDDEGFVL